MCEATELALLLRRAGRGDEGAFAALYDATSAHTYGLALSVTGDRGQAEEVLLGAYLEIWRRSGRLDATGSPMAWILMIVYRNAADWVRSGPAKLRLVPDVRGKGAAGRAGPLQASLTPAQSAAVSLNYVDTRSPAEVGNIVDFAAGTARIRVPEGLAHPSDLAAEE